MKKSQLPQPLAPIEHDAYVFNGDYFEVDMTLDLKTNDVLDLSDWSDHLKTLGYRWAASFPQPSDGCMGIVATVHIHPGIKPGLPPFNKTFFLVEIDMGIDGTGVMVVRCSPPEFLKFLRDYVIPLTRDGEMYNTAQMLKQALDDIRRQI